MTKRISEVTARENLGAILDGVDRGDRAVVERAGNAMGVIVPVLEYEIIRRIRSEALQSLEAHRAKLTPVDDIAAAEAEILAECQAARHPNG